MIGLIRRWWNRRYPGWVPEVTLRYLPVVDLLKPAPPTGPVLEVGINKDGLTAYFPIPIVGVDVSFGEARSSLVRPVYAKGQALPFKSKCFECTISLDTLEHIPPSQRGMFVRELLRVTHRRVYLGCPMGPEAEREDRAVDAYYRAKRGAPFDFLTEHIRYGLPTFEALTALVTDQARRQGRVVQVTALPNLNMWVHWVLLALWIRTGPVSYLFHRLSVLLVHVRRWLNFGSCYRQILVVTFE